jgi:hypothetical protein
VDDTLKQIHNKKVNVVNFVTGDLNIDDMYNNMMYVNKFMETYNTTKAHKYCILINFFLSNTSFIILCNKQYLNQISIYSKYSRVTLQ